MGALDNSAQGSTLRVGSEWAATTEKETDVLTYEYVPCYYQGPFGWFIFRDGVRTGLKFYAEADAAAYCKRWNAA